MNDTKYILDYFSFLEKSYSSFLDNGEVKEDARKAIMNRLELIRQFKSQIKWQLLSPEEKQASRIEWLASQEKRGISAQKKRQIIELYASIQLALPHILALNHNELLSEFKSLCYRICRQIDFREMAFDQIKKDDILPLENPLKELKNIEEYPLMRNSKEIVFQLKGKIINFFNVVN